MVATTIQGSGGHWVNRDGESGLNAKSGDAKRLAEAIQAITAHPMIYERYAEGARKRYERMFTFDRMIDNTLKLYSETNATNK